MFDLPSNMPNVGEHQVALAGAAGGIVRWFTLRERLRDGLVSVAVGLLCAVYAAPVAIPMIAPTIGKLAPAESAGTLAGFLIGIGGVGFSGFIIDAWQKRRNLLKTKEGKQ